MPFFSCTRTCVRNTNKQHSFRCGTRADSNIQTETKENKKKNWGEKKRADVMKSDFLKNQIKVGEKRGCWKQGQWSEVAEDKVPPA